MKLPKINLTTVRLTSRPRQHLQDIKQSPSGVDNMKIGGNLTTLKHLLFDTFGVPYQVLDRALDGDESTIQQLSALASKCARISENAPQLEKAMTEIIDGTVVGNVTVANILRQASAGALKIQAAKIGLGQTLDTYQFESWQAEKREKNERLYQQNVRKELVSLQKENDLNRAVKQRVDALHQLNAATRQTAIWQLQADKEYQEAHIDHSWEYGDRAKHSLISKKEYTGLAKAKEVMKNWFNGG